MSQPDEITFLEKQTVIRTATWTKSNFYEAFLTNYPSSQRDHLWSILFSHCTRTSSTEETYTKNTVPTYEYRLPDKGATLMNDTDGHTTAIRALLHRINGFQSNPNQCDTCGEGLGVLLVGTTTSNRSFSDPITRTGKYCVLHFTRRMNKLYPEYDFDTPCYFCGQRFCDKRNDDFGGIWMHDECEWKKWQEEKKLSNIYILELENGYYYVGRSGNVERRFTDHQNGTGSHWTALHKPVRIERIIPNVSPYEEDRYVKEYMDKYGVDKVRGGTYNTIQLEEIQIYTLEKEKWGANDWCFNCGQPDHFQYQCNATKDIHGKPVNPVVGGRKTMMKGSSKSIDSGGYGSSSGTSSSSSSVSAANTVRKSVLLGGTSTPTTEKGNLMMDDDSDRYRTSGTSSSGNAVASSSSALVWNSNLRRSSAVGSSSNSGSVGKMMYPEENTTSSNSTVQGTEIGTTPSSTTSPLSTPKRNNPQSSILSTPEQIVQGGGEHGTMMLIHDNSITKTTNTSTTSSSKANYTSPKRPLSTNDTNNDELFGSNTTPPYTGKMVPSNVSNSAYDNWKCSCGTLNSVNSKQCQKCTAIRNPGYSPSSTLSLLNTTISYKETTFVGRTENDNNLFSNGNGINNSSNLKFAFGNRSSTKSMDAAAVSNPSPSSGTNTSNIKSSSSLPTKTSLSAARIEAETMDTTGSSNSGSSSLLFLPQDHHTNIVKRHCSSSGENMSNRIVTSTGSSLTNTVTDSSTTVPEIYRGHHSLSNVYQRNSKNPPPKDAFTLYDIQNNLPQ